MSIHPSGCRSGRSLRDLWRYFCITLLVLPSRAVGWPQLESGSGLSSFRLVRSCVWFSLLSTHRTGRDNHPPLISRTEGLPTGRGYRPPSSQCRGEPDAMDLVASLAGVQWLARQLVAALTSDPPRCIGAASSSPGPDFACLLCLLLLLKATTKCWSAIRALRKWQGSEKRKRKCRARAFGRITSSNVIIIIFALCMYGVRISRLILGTPISYEVI